MKRFLFLIMISTIMIASPFNIAIATDKVAYPKYDIKIYSGKSFSHQVIGKAAKMQILTITSTSQDWYEIMTEFGKKGWIHSNWVETDLNKIKNREAENKKRIQQEIKQLETKAVSLPVSDIYGKLEIYSQLSRKVPDNKSYQDKLKYYKDESEKLYTCRRTRWGMSLDQVKASESTTELLDEKPNILSYKESIAGLDSYLFYYFTDNNLDYVKYAIIEKHSNKTDYVRDYTMLQGLLNQKYGKPKRNDILWKNDLYKNDPEDYGTAISIGHVFYYTEWDLQPTSVSLILGGDNYKIDFSIEYAAKDFIKRRREKENKKVLDKL